MWVCFSLPPALVRSCSVVAKSEWIWRHIVTSKNAHPEPMTTIRRWSSPDWTEFLEKCGTFLVEKLHFVNFLDFEIFWAIVGLGLSFKGPRVDLDRKIWQSAHLCYWVTWYLWVGLIISSQPGVHQRPVHAGTDLRIGQIGHGLGPRATIFSMTTQC